MMGSSGHRWMYLFPLVLLIMNPTLLDDLIGVTTSWGVEGARSDGERPSRQKDKTPPPGSKEDDLINEVKYWSLSFGNDIKEGGTVSTCVRKIREAFNEKNVKVDNVDANEMLKQMRDDLKNMLNWKKESVTKIVNEAERLSSNHTPDKHLYFKYPNAKRLYDVRKENVRANATPMELDYMPTFGDIEVNPKYSVFHVPVNVYEEGNEVLNHIKWASGLDSVFINNLAADPSLSWQFFGSNTGFLNLFPAAKWRVPVYTKTLTHSSTPHIQIDHHPDPFLIPGTLDLYDSRMRNWFIKAAASPKDMIILLDGSGSMTGQRREIAKNVVLNILDTLTEDDFVNIVRFSDDLEPVVECFGINELVQANKQNLREFKDRMEHMNTSDIANFTLALSHAFETMNQLYLDKKGAKCNQAIMLVTDGASDTYEAVFQRYNWPRIPVRVFTYLVGREVTETREVNWMACHNKGYYTHVANLAEVREQVQLYIPVMSRPLVLAGREKRPYVWSPVYADVENIPLTNWLWEERQKEKIRDAIKAKIRDQVASASKEVTVTSSETEPPEIEIPEEDKEEEEEEEEDYDNLDSRGNKQRRSVQATSGGSIGSNRRSKSPAATRQDSFDQRLAQPYHSPEPPSSSPSKPKRQRKLNLMTTISAPVYDLKNTTNITVRILVKNMWEEEQQEIRTANLLGVAGVDVPIREILKKTPAFKLGVNGYSFLTTSNGFLLHHPDLRPIFMEMLKPFYSTMDVTQVEFTDSIDAKPGVVDSTVKQMRDDMVTRKNGYKSFEARIHMDNLRRVVTRKNSYYYGPIENTPFSLAIVIPEPYGRNKIDAQIEVKRRDANFTHYFKGDNWRVHPDWTYCENRVVNPSKEETESPEQMIRMFLREAETNVESIRWKTQSIKPEPILGNMLCERDLLQSLVFDAKATKVDPVKCGALKNQMRNENDVTKTYGISMTFAATRSGLTRFEDYRSEEERMEFPDEDPFYDVRVRATDEDFYKRAVDFNGVNASAFVYAIEPNRGQPENPYVIGSHAIFVGTGKQAPAAVVGTLFKHDKFRERFFNHTMRCGGPNCRIKCADEQTTCLLIDNSGFILVAENPDLTGKFLGEYDYKLVETLVQDKVFVDRKVYDYQSICIDTYQVSGPSNKLWTPVDMITSTISFLWTRTTVLALELYLNGLINSFQSVWAQEEPKGEGEGEGAEGEEDTPRVMEEGFVEEVKRFINKTKPRPCVKEYRLFDATGFINRTRGKKGKNKKCAMDGCEETYIAQSVPYTNLISLVIVGACDCEATSMQLEHLAKSFPSDCSVLPQDRTPGIKSTVCVNSHPQEKHIKICGGAGHLCINPLLILTVMMMAHVFHLFSSSDGT